mmetsp:Transcript_17220/g.37457  ORF Transcript_17220/g.37457 Transcript_17220/m.37457 type:complete len:281 (-) Transcript_17220:1073-1915(-)
MRQGCDTTVHAHSAQNFLVIRKSVDYVLRSKVTQESGDDAGASHTYDGHILYARHLACVVSKKLGKVHCGRIFWDMPHCSTTGQQLERGVWARRQVPRHTQTCRTHDVQSLQWPASVGGFAAEHYRIRALTHCSSNIGNFCTCWGRVVYHALKHVGRHYDRLAELVALRHDFGLHNRYFLKTEIGPKITTGHHRPIRSREDLVDVPHCSNTLNFRNHHYVRILRPQEGLNLLNCTGIANKGKRDKINIVVNAKLQVCPVLLRDGGQIRATFLDVQVTSTS